MKRLAKNAGVMLEDPDDIDGERSFSRDAINRFGALSNELVDSQPKIHLQMSVLATLTIEGLEAGNEEFATSILNFLDDVLDHDPISSEIPNAVAISFLLPEQITQAAKVEGALSIVPTRVLTLIENDQPEDRDRDQTKA